MEKPRHRIGLLLLLASALGAGADDVWTTTVFGKVAEDSQPIAGAWVYLRHIQTKLVDSLQTDSSGGYAFSPVTGCESGCDIEARHPGYWFFQSDTFQLSGYGTKVLDVRLLRIHALTVHVVKGEDTAQAVTTSQAVLFSSSGEAPRCMRADSAGRMQFHDLQSSTGYLLTVAAPGRKATSSELHFHDPVSNSFARIVLDSDVAETNKSLHGTLSAIGGSAVGEKIILSCVTEQIAADLFTVVGPDGGYAVAGLPAVCDSVMLFAGRDSVDVALPEKDNHFDWSARFPLPDFARPTRAARPGAAWRAILWRDYDASGRRLNAAPARSRP